jgi:alkanesulfonate monooxygenase SsuD/methylene tetrahydromethanopterin reductase-like flavin-dependent oxidoreductase (luciferase family)
VATATCIVRFDLRAPAFGAPTHELYAAFLEMAAFAEQHDFTAVVVSEHHACEDGYLPSPIVAAAAAAARTTTIPINVAALLLPLYDPVKLAEDIAVLDHLSRGRVSYVVGIGYRPAEYEALGRDFRSRARTAEEHVALLRRAWSGEPFEHEGRTVTVRPVPYTKPHPALFYGGGSVAAARRAARLDLPFFPQLASTRVVQAYADERERLGLPPGFVFAPGEGPVNVFVSEDPDATWARVGEHLLYDARSYAQWQIDAGLDSAALERATSVEELRAGTVYAVMTPDECIAYAGAGNAVSLHPLCGGVAPEIGWETLELVATKVLPALG